MVFPFEAQASNIYLNDNPPFTREDFYSFFPQFQGNIPGTLIDQFLIMATNAVLERRWHSHWKYGMSLFVAHFSILWMRATGGPDPTAQTVIAAAVTAGFITGESAGDLSFSQDQTFVMDGLKGWANWTSTSYGVQFATLARMLGKAGIYVV